VYIHRFAKLRSQQAFHALPSVTDAQADPQGVKSVYAAPALLAGKKKSYLGLLKTYSFNTHQSIIPNYALLQASSQLKMGRENHSENAGLLVSSNVNRPLTMVDLYLSRKTVSKRLYLARLRAGFGIMRRLSGGIIYCLIISTTLMR
jgi:hypothetical protein